MDTKDSASIIAFARLLGIQGTDEEIINAFVSHYINAQKSLKKTKIRTYGKSPATPQSMKHGL